MVSPSRCPPWQPERPGPTRREPRRAQRSYTTPRDTIQPAPSETEIVPARESFEHLDEPVADTRCYRLLLRFGLVNLVALALLGSAAVQGWIATVLVADKTHLSIAICAVFVAGLGLCARKVWQTSNELNGARAGEAARGSLVMRYVTAVQGPAPREPGRSLQALFVPSWPAVSPWSVRSRARWFSLGSSVP